MKRTSLISGLQKSLGKLEKEMDGGHGAMLTEAKHACHKTLPAMAEVRSYADALESLIADDLWPLPTYQEMLFIK